MSLTENDLQKLTRGGANVLSPSGDKIGGVGQVYLDDSTGKPSWVTVKTGLFGTSESFVPLGDASLNGDDVTVNFEKDKIKDAPRVDADGSITPEEEQELYRYYEMSGHGDDSHRDHGLTGRDDHDKHDHDKLGRSDRGLDDNDHDKLGRSDRGLDKHGHDKHGHDDRGLDGNDHDRAGVDAGADDRAKLGNDRTDRDDAASITRSEEELNVGTKKQETGKARLRKYVVTENVTTTVPVEHEEVRIEREPIDAGDRAADAGADLGDDSAEVTLTEEVPVVEKKVVAKEKVRLAKDTVTDEAQVAEEVRKEEIDTDVDGDRDHDHDAR